MILFCDTSALVKLYLKEEFSHEVRALSDKAKVIGVRFQSNRHAWAGN